MTVAGQKILQRYELIAAANDRGLGEAWTARDTKRQDRTVLVKLFLAGPRNAAEWEAVGRDLAGADTNGMARHLDHGLDGDRFAVIYEPLEGRSLWSWLEGWRQSSRGPDDTPPPAAVQTIFLALSSAMQSLHGKSIAHRALNPHSVILQWKGQALQLSVLDAAVAPGLESGELSVCAPYHLPERVGRKAVPRSATRDDLFALAVMALELHTLRSTPGEGRMTFGELVTRSSANLDATLAKLSSELATPIRALLTRTMEPGADESKVNVASLRREIQVAWKSAQLWIEPGERKFTEPPTPSIVPSVPSAPVPVRSDKEAIRGFAQAERRSDPVATPARPVAAPPTAAAPVSSAPPRAPSSFSPVASRPPIVSRSDTPPPAPMPRASLQPSPPAFSAASTLVDVDVPGHTDQHPAGDDDSDVQTHVNAPGKGFAAAIASARMSPTGTLDLSGNEDVVPIMPAAPRAVPGTTLPLDQYDVASTLPLDAFDDQEQTHSEIGPGRRGAAETMAIQPRAAAARPRPASPAATLDLASNAVLDQRPAVSPLMTLGPNAHRPSVPSPVSWPPPPVPPMAPRVAPMPPQVRETPWSAQTLEAPGLAQSQPEETRTGPSPMQIAMVVGGGILVGVLLILLVFRS